MQGTLKKGTTVALAAVLLFWSAFPVPLGKDAIDRVRYEQAQAAVPIAIPIALGTILAAGGFLVGGTTVAQYDANLNSVYEGFSNATSYWSSSWSQYVQDKGSFDAAIQSAVTVDGQNINLQTLTDAGFYDSLHNYSVYLVDNGQAALGSASNDDVRSVLYFGDYAANAVSELPPCYSVCEEYKAQKGNADYQCIGYKYQKYGTNGNNESWQFYLVPPNETFTFYTTPKLIGANRSGYIADIESYKGNTPYANSYKTWNEEIELKGSDTVLYAGYDFVCTNVDASTGMVSNTAAVINSALYSGTAAYPTTTVQPFEPTAEQLEAGYTTADVLEAVNVIGGDVAEVVSQLTGLTTLLAPLAGIAANVQSIRANWDTALANVFSPQLTAVNALVTWAGDTPFGTIMGTVIDGVQAIPDGIRNVGESVVGGLQGVLEGVQAVPGALQGVLEGVLEGVQAIPVSIAGVIEAVQAGVVDLTGALDASLHPSMPNPTEVVTPVYADKQTFENVLRDKAPFAYMFAFKEMVDGASSSYSNSPSFRVRHTFDIMGNEVEYDINAEPWLNGDIGGVTIAELLRASVSLTICMGLLYAAYRTAMAAVKG